MQWRQTSVDSVYGSNILNTRKGPAEQNVFSAHLKELSSVFILSSAGKEFQRRGAIEE